MKLTYKMSILCLSLTSASFADGVGNLEFTKYVKPGTRSVQERKMSNDVCAELGAIDVTDSAEIWLTENARDPVFCMGPPLNNLDPLNNTIDQQFNNETFLRTIGLSVTAPNFTANYGPYFVRADSRYSGVSVGSPVITGVRVIADNCGTAGSVPAQYSSGVGYASTTCSYPSSRGGRQSIGEVLVGSQYKAEYGVIILR